MVPLHFLDGEELPKICCMCIRCTQPELHTFLLLQYTSVMAAIVNQLNINGDAAARLFERWPPPSMVATNAPPGWWGAAKNLFQVRSPYERLLIVWRWTCSTHAGSGWCGCGGCHDVNVCLLVLTRLCCTVCGLPVVGRNFLENEPPWGTGWWCCGCVLPSLPAQLPSILNAHFWL